MKILTKEEEAAHYSATLKGGILGSVGGLVVGVAGVSLASRRYHFFRSLTLPLKAFLVTSSGTFAGIIAADHASRSFQSLHNPKDREFQELERRRWQEEHAGMTWTQRAMEFGKRERYKIVGASWVASMITAFVLVNRNKYLTGPQKLVQARVYAQFLTLGVLVASAAFEIADRRNDEGKLWEAKKVIDPDDPEHKRFIETWVRRDDTARSDSDELWKEMVAAEEERLKEREEEKKEFEADRRKHRAKHESKEDKDGKKGKQ